MVPSGVTFIGEQQILAEALEPGFGGGKEPVGIGASGFEGRQLGAGKPGFWQRTRGFAGRESVHARPKRTDCTEKSINVVSPALKDLMRNVSALILIGCLCLLQSAARAQSSADPSDLFLNVYTAVQQAERSEGQGNFKAAMSRLQYAAKALDQIAAKYPTWQPVVVEFRRTETGKAIQRVQEKLAKFGPGKEGEVGGTVEPALPVDDTKLLFTPPAEAAPAPVPMPDSPAGQRPSGGSASSGNPIREIEDRMDRLQRDLGKAQEDLSKSEVEKRRLAKELEAAVKARETSESKQQLLQQRADRAEQALMEALSKGDNNSDAVKTLQAQLDKAKRQLRDVTIDGEAEAEFRQQLSDRLKSAQTKIVTLIEQRDAAQKLTTDTPTKIAGIQKELDKARKEKEDVLARLTKTETQLADVTKQRDDALQQIVKMKEAQKQVDKLVAENADLMTKLTEAEKSIKVFRADGVEKDKQIASLKGELADTKKQLSSAKEQSADYQRQMADLQTKLDERGKELAKLKSDSAAGAEERKKLEGENLILRGIVLRQQREQARRDQTRKLVLGELAKLEIKSKSLISQIDYLGQPVVQLSAKERALFKQPELQISDTEISVAAAQPDEPTMLEKAAPPVETPAAAKSAPMPKPDDSRPTPKPADEPKTTTPQETPPLPPVPAEEPPTQLAKNTEPTMPTKSPSGDSSAAKKTADPSGPTPPAPGTSNTPNVPPELLPLAREGKEQFEQGNYRDAEKIYERVLAKAPNNLYILSNLGVVRFRAGKLKLAEEALKKATQIAPEDAFSHTTLGIVYYSQAKYDDAVNELTKAVAIQPKNATAHNYLGITASQKGWQESAQKELETACALDPTYADAHFNLAVVFATQTPPNKEEAKKYYKKAIELGADPDSSLEGLIK